MKKEIIAVDLGGTNLRVALVRNNKIIKYIKKRTPKEKNLIMKSLFTTISSLMNKNIKGICIAAPGPLKNGFIKNTPNISLKNCNLKKAVKDKFKVKVEVENDANCVALAEAKMGCKKKNFFILTLGTGIGGGIIIDGKLYKGFNYGGELGHIILDKGQDFEKLAAWKRIRKLTRYYFKKELLVKDLIKINNLKSKRILDEISDYLGQGIASLINIFDPDIVILSGGMKESGSYFLNMIKKSVKKYTIIPRNIEIKWSRLKHPAIFGASLLIK